MSLSLSFGITTVFIILHFHFSSSLFGLHSVMSSPNKPIENIHLLEKLDILWGDFYNLSILICQFTDDNADGPNYLNKEKLLHFVLDVTKMSTTSRELQALILDMDCKALLKK